jgi:diaminopimelate decarboxylase
MDNRLTSQLVEQYGSPLYVYEGDIIKRQVDRLMSAFDVPDLKINYACKALNNQAILKLMKKFGTGLDTVSIQEAKLGIRAGFKPEEILYTPNCVGFQEIKAAVELGVGVNIDNIEMLEEFGHQFPGHPVCIRFNPHIMAGGNLNISVGHIDSKFGISIYQLPLVKRLVAALNIHVNGVHMHTGSDIMDIEVFLQATDILFNTAREFDNLDFIDFGSGFKVPYRPGDIETDIEEFGARMSEKFNGFCKEYGKELSLVFEPGKFLVSQCGHFLTTVNVVKQTTSNVFAGLDSGFNHFIRPMLYNAHHEIENISNPDGKPRVYTIVGYICETDTFCVNRRLTEVRPGDILAFRNAGAYCNTMASNYNSRYRPAEVLLWQGKDHLIRRRENIEDLVSTEIEIEI